MNTFPSRRDTQRGGSWTNPDPLPKTFSLEEPSRFNKRPYEEGLISYPMLKIPKLKRSRDPLPVSSRKPSSLTEEVLLTDKPTFEEKTITMFESGARRDFRDPSPAKASESWRAEPQSTEFVKSEEALWNEETDRDYAKKVYERNFPHWRKDSRAEFESDRNSRGRYSPAQEKDRTGKDFFDVQKGEDMGSSPHYSMLSENKNQGSYEKLMKVVMGSINPSASANLRMTDRGLPADGGVFATLNRESDDGYNGSSLDVERYNNSRLASKSFLGSSFESSLSGRTKYVEDNPINFDSSFTGPPRWESWRNLNSTLSSTPSKDLNSADRYVPPSDSWRSDVSKSESWRNVSKPTTENFWGRSSVPTRQDRFPVPSRDLRGFGLAPVPYDRQHDLGASGYPGPSKERNFRY